MLNAEHKAESDCHGFVSILSYAKVLDTFKFDLLMVLEQNSGDHKDCTRFHCNPSNSFQDISLPKVSKMVLE